MNKMRCRGESGELMKRFSLPLIATLLFLANGFGAARDQATNDVLTYHNDIYRTGVYAGETMLRPTNVSGRRFSKVFARRVVGQIWGQPLYVRGVPVNGRLRNVVYVATSENMVYGFDADDRTPDEQTRPLMCVFLGAPVPIRNDQIFYTIYPSNGIASTPVVDLGTPPDPGKGTLYVVAKLDRDKKFHVFALDLRTLGGSAQCTPGALRDVIVTGTAGQGDTAISFDSEDHLNRPALLISKNQMIIAFGSGPNNDQDAPNFHGWVISYSLPDLVRTGVFVTTPTQGMGGIWQYGSGPAADDEGNVYFMTGNGHFQDQGRQPDLANSFVKLATRDGLQLVDWYAPPSRNVLERCDLDLGASGPVVVQDSGKVLGAGKSGILYVLDKGNMGKTDTALDHPGDWRGAPDCPPGKCFRIAENQFQPPGKSKLACDMNEDSEKTGFNSGGWHITVNSYPHVHGSPVVWKLGNKSFNLYVWPEEDFLKAYHFDGQKFSPTPVGSSAPLAAAMMSMPGGLLSLSWDGTNTNTGIIWTSRPNPHAQHIVGNPFVSVLHDQQHFVFRDKNGAIWDSFYLRGEDRWRFQEINTNGHPAASDTFVSVFDSADQHHFVYPDSFGHVWDSFYRRTDGTWHYQPIDTRGHAPVGRIFVSAFFDQQHFVFRDGAGRIWDSFYAQADNHWHCQQINTGWLPAKSGTCQPIHTGGHPAVGNVFVSVFGAAQQQHFVYTDQFRKIWDAYYARTNNSWHYQQIDTHGHTPVGEIFVSAFFDQQHFVFRDGAGRIWDSFYAQADNHWHFQPIQPCLYQTTDHENLAPDEAPCNAINKIVHGYLQAFDATAGRNGQLKELWNSDDNPGDQVKWFAKNSPPTIADGKVFLAEFPPPVNNGIFDSDKLRNWSARNAFGRLIVYSLR